MLDKTFEHNAIEKTHYELWEASGAFRADTNSQKVPHTIMMPPPNVTGTLHIGHALTFSSVVSGSVRSSATAFSGEFFRDWTTRS